MARMININAALTLAQKDALEKLARKEGKSQNALIREAVDLLLKEHGRKKKVFRIEDDDEEAEHETASLSAK